jgi:hypothetical protein
LMIRQHWLHKYFVQTMAHYHLRLWLTQQLSRLFHFVQKFVSL